MNEYAIIMRLLTKPGNPMGAGIDDLLGALSLPEVVGRHVLFQHLGALSKELAPIGLSIKHNPIDHVFYLDAEPGGESPFRETILSDRLAATLLTVITLAYQEGGWVSLDRVREFRRKARRGILTDLRELESMGYVEIDDTKKNARPGPRVAFEIDYEAFFKRLVSQ
ncbi:MAG: hypothetical protein ACFE7R_00455 [Candidatus Hodarchaeota archaeon]